MKNQDKAGGILPMPDPDMNCTKIYDVFISYHRQIDKMSNFINFNVAYWNPYQSTFDLQLLPLNGDKQRIIFMYVRLKDKAGNVTELGFTSKKAGNVKAGNQTMTITSLKYNSIARASRFLYINYCLFCIFNLL